MVSEANLSPTENSTHELDKKVFYLTLKDVFTNPKIAWTNIEPKCFLCNLALSKQKSYTAIDLETFTSVTPRVCAVFHEACWDIVDAFLSAVIKNFIFYLIFDGGISDLGKQKGSALTSVEL